MKVRLFGLLTLLVAATPCHITAKPDAPLPSTITIAMQPSQAGSQRSGPMNSVLLKALLKTPAKVNIYLCPWARCLKAIETGAADILDDLYYTTERDRYIYFLRPEYDRHDAYVRFYTLAKNQNTIRQWHDLYGKGIGTVRGNVYVEKFDQDRNLNKYPSVHISDSINLLVNQRIDAIIAPPTLTPEIIREFDPNNRITPSPFKIAVSEPVFIGLSRKSGWINHVEQLETALIEVLAE